LSSADELIFALTSTCAFVVAVTLATREEMRVVRGVPR
jgi:hypothetical protein